MRETTYSFANKILNKDQISELNKTIHKNFIDDLKDSSASGAIKSLYSPETLLDPDSTSVPYSTVPELASLIAESGQGEACFSRQFFRYTVGRNENSEGDELLIRNYSADLRSGGGMRGMLIDLTLSPAFGIRR